MNLFEDHLTDSLRQSTVNLTGDQERSHDVATVIDREVLQQLDLARLREEFNDRNVRAERERLVGRLEEAGRFETNLDIVRHVAAVGSSGNICQGDAPIRNTLDLVLAIDQFDVFDGRLEHAGRDLGRLVANLVQRHQQRSSTNGESAATHGAIPLRVGGSVTVMNDDTIEVSSEVLFSHLGERRLGALAVRRDSGEDRHGTARLNPNLGAVVRSESANLNVGRDANTNVPTLSQRLGLLGTQSRVVGKFESMIERLLVFAGVVVLAAQCRVREHVWSQEVDAANFSRIKTTFVCNHVDHALEVEGSLRTTGATVRTIGHRVRVDAEYFVIEVRDVVRAGGHHPGRPGKPEVLRVGSGIEDNARLQPGDLAIRIGAGFELGVLVATMGGAEEALAPALHPFDRLLQNPARGGNNVFLDVRTDLCAEPSADFWRDAANTALGQVQCLGNRVAIPVRSLGRGPECHTINDRIRLGNDSAAFHRDGMAAW